MVFSGSALRSQEFSGLAGPYNSWFCSFDSRPVLCDVFDTFVVWEVVFGVSTAIAGVLSSCLSLRDCNRRSSFVSFPKHFVALLI